MKRMEGVGDERKERIGRDPYTVGKETLNMGELD